MLPLVDWANSSFSSAFVFVSTASLHVCTCVVRISDSLIMFKNMGLMPMHTDFLWETKWCVNIGNLQSYSVWDPVPVSPRLHPVNKMIFSKYYTVLTLSRWEVWILIVARGAYSLVVNIFACHVGGPGSKTVQAACFMADVFIYFAFDCYIHILYTSISSLHWYII